jgi:hypothetical protein
MFKEVLTSTNITNNNISQQVRISLTISQLYTNIYRLEKCMCTYRTLKNFRNSVPLFVDDLLIIIIIKISISVRNDVFIENPFTATLQFFSLI